VKGRLPARVGLGDGGRALWRWRADVAAALGNGPARHGVAVTPAAPCGILAGFTLHAWPGPGAPALAAHVLWWDGQEWSEDPELIARRLAAAQEAGADEPAPAACARDPVTAAMRQIGAAVRARVRVLRRSCWDAPRPAPASRRLLARLDALAAAAARRRDSALLPAVQRAVRFAAGGHTAGESVYVRRLAALPDRELLACLGRLPEPTAPPDTLQARLTGVILFGGVATFPRCRTSARCCSISTAP
ncbi:MAG TPA: hypothetical protein VFU46_08840, partial [Gemmatimonadales bacterium]|nr:hypothetical protein [Gemmatimonadales bacterium]